MTSEYDRISDELFKLARRQSRADKLRELMAPPSDIFDAPSVGNLSLTEAAEARGMSFREAYELLDRENAERLGHELLDPVTRGDGIARQEPTADAAQPARVPTRKEAREQRSRGCNWLMCFLGDPANLAEYANRGDPWLVDQMAVAGIRVHRRTLGRWMEKAPELADLLMAKQEQKDLRRDAHASSHGDKRARNLHR